MDSPEWPGSLYSDLDELTSFDAMVRFLFNWWDRSGRPDHSVFDQGDVLWLLSACDRSMTSDGSPSDPAMWDHWKNALAEARRERELRSN
jgi:hypothetical protein